VTAAADPRKLADSVREALRKIPWESGITARGCWSARSQLEKYACDALDALVAQAEQYRTDLDKAAVENASLRAALEGYEPSVWAERMAARMYESEIVAQLRAELEGGRHEGDKVGSVGSSAAGVDGAGHAPGRHEPVGERQGRQPALPTRLLVDAAGFVWRDFGEDWVSGCPFNPDNEPLPEPITVYVPASEHQEEPSS
jgi:hypothetical protein